MREAYCATLMLFFEAIGNERKGERGATVRAVQKSADYFAAQRQLAACHHATLHHCEQRGGAQPLTRSGLFQILVDIDDENRLLNALEVYNRSQAEYSEEDRELALRDLEQAVLRVYLRRELVALAA